MLKKFLSILALLSFLSSNVFAQTFPLQASGIMQPSVNFMVVFPQSSPDLHLWFGRGQVCGINSPRHLCSLSFHKWRAHLDYDKNSNLDFVTLPGTHGTVDYVYDELNRLTDKNFPGNPARNMVFVYDLGSRLTDANNNAAQIHFTHD